jgi:RNA polymerase sigma-70 factor (ECF subfamily)
MVLQKNNKQHEFAKLVKEHQVALRGFVRLLGVRADAVDDLAQETFLLAYHELERFREGEDFGKWLRGIARNLARNEIRKVARRCRIIDEELTQHLILKSEEKMSESEFDQEDLSALQSCMNQLSQRNQELLSGRYKQDWNSNVLAEKFKMTTSAVRITLMRIRQQLKGCIEKKVSHA